MTDEEDFRETIATILRWLRQCLDDPIRRIVVELRSGRRLRITIPDNWEHDSDASSLIIQLQE